MKLSPSTIAANLSAAAAAEAEAAANSNSTNMTLSNTSSQPNSTIGTIAATAPSTTSTSISSSSHPNANMNPTSILQHHQSSSNKLSPKDSQVVAAILNEMGISEYEPRVLPQLIEFAYRYVSHVLEDAQLFSSYAKKKVIDSDDVSLAIQMQIDRSFVGPPSRDILLEISRNKNTQPLPPIKSHNGMRLPADRYSLVAPNFRLVSKNKQQSNVTPKPIVRSVSSLLSGNSFMNTKLSLTPTTTINPIGNKQINQSLPNNDIYGAKRKLDEA